MNDVLSRYSARRSVLSSTKSSPGEVLEAAGDLLRRSTRVGIEGVDAALRGLGRPQVEAWLKAQKPQSLQPLLLTDIATCDRDVSLIERMSCWIAIKMSRSIAAEYNW